MLLLYSQIKIELLTKKKKSNKIYTNPYLLHRVSDGNSLDNLKKRQYNIVVSCGTNPIR